MFRLGLDRSHGIVLLLYLLIGVPASAADTWIEIRSPHFTVISNAGEKRAREVARELEQIRQVFRAALPSAKQDPALPVTVFAVRDEEGLKELLPQFWEGDGPRPWGAFFKVPDKYVIALRTDGGGSDRFQPIYHEYFHLLTSLNLEVVPVWLNEGLAEFWSQTVIRRNQVELGNTSPLHLQHLRRRMMPLLELVAATGNPHESDPRRVSVFYAQSWALTHLLMMSDENLSGREKLASYVDRIQEGQDAVAAFEAVFGQLDGVEEELRRYVRRPKLFAMRMDVPVPADPKAFPPRELLASEALALRGNLLAFGARPETAVPLLEEALHLDRKSGVAMEGFGFYHFRRGAFDDAKAWFERAIQSGSRSFRSYYFVSQIEKSGGDVRAPAVGDALRKAIELEPDFAPALSELASHLAARQERLEEALALAMRATELEPDNAWTWVNLGLVYVVVGHPDKARKAGERAEAIARTPPEREAVQELRLMVWELDR